MLMFTMFEISMSFKLSTTFVVFVVRTIKNRTGLDEVHSITYLDDRGIVGSKHSTIL